MRRKVAVILVLQLFALSIVVNAVEMRIVNPIVSLTFSGTTANCSTTVISAGDELDIVLELWKGDTLIDSWPAYGSGRASVKGSCQVIKGETYTLIVTGTASGRYFSSPPLSRTC